MLKGDLSATALTQVLTDLAAGAATGCIHLVDPAGETAKVYLRGGAVYAVNAPGRRPQLGARLVSSGALGPEALADALEAQRTELQGWRLGELLVHLGYVDQPVVEDFVNEQVRESLSDLLPWRAGTWKFRVNERTREDVAPPATVESLLGEITSRRSHWAAMEDTLHGPDAVPVLSTAGTSSDEMEIDPDAWSLLCKVDGTRTVVELARECGFTLYEAGQVVFGLVGAGLLEIEQGQVEEPVEEPAELVPGDLAARLVSALVGAPEQVEIPSPRETGSMRTGAHGEPTRQLELPAAENEVSDSISRVSAALASLMGPTTTDELFAPLTPRPPVPAEPQDPRAAERARREAVRRSRDAEELATAQAELEAARAAEQERRDDLLPDGHVAQVVDLHEVREAARLGEQERAEAERAEAERLAAEAEAERLETERIAAEAAEAERVAAEQAEAERIEAERNAAEHAEAERVAAEQAEAERVQAQRIEAERIAAEQAEAERVEAQRIAAEQAEAERVEAERIAAEQAEAESVEAERIAAEQAEAERVAAEQAEAQRVEAERIAAEQAEAERLAAEQAEAERLAAEQAEAERIAAEQAEAERIAAEQAEAERAEVERIAAEQAEAERLAAEAARIAAEQAEAERLAAEAAEAERIAAEQAEAERVAAEQAEAQRVEAERVEAERAAAELAEAQRVDAERVAAELAEAERIDAERVHAERIAAEQAEAERADAERIAAEQAARAEFAEAARLEDERAVMAAVEAAGPAQVGSDFADLFADDDVQVPPMMDREAQAAAFAELSASASMDIAPPAPSPVDEPVEAWYDDDEPLPTYSSHDTDTASLLRELSSLGLDDDPPPAPAPRPAPRPVSALPAKKKKGLFGRG